MRGKLLALTLTLILSTAGAHAYDLNDGLVAYWSFDNCSAVDDSGNGHDGKIYGNPECVDGIKGKAFKFYTKTGHYKGDTIVVEPISLSENFTVTYWTKFYDDSGNSGLEVEDDKWCSSPFGLGLGLKSIGSYINWSCGPYEDTHSVKLEDIEKEKWYMATFVIKGNKIEYFVNNKKVGEKTWKSSYKTLKNLVLAINSSPAGGWESYYHEFYKSILDEIRIYNRALSEEEVKALYNFYIGEVPDNETSTDYWEVANHSGWYLLGAPEETTPEEISNKIENVFTVWAWNPETMTWQVYSPEDSVRQILQKYIDLGTIDELENIKKGQGFWIRVK